MAVDNSENDTSRSEMLLLTSSTCLILAWISVSLRVWVRAVMIKSFGWDDSLMVLALMIFTVFCSSMIVMSQNGGGDLHVDPDNLPLLVKHMFVFETTYIGVMVVLKLSIGIFFLRIVVRKWQTFIIRAIILLVALYSACYFFVALFQCGAPQDYLENRVKHHCVSDSVVLSTAYAHTAIGALTDWAFVILPIYIVWHANMSTSSKISVAAILTLGALGSIATLVRFKYVPALIEYDHFWYSAAPLAVWSNIEPGLGIVAGSLVTLRPLLRACMRRVRSFASEAHSVYRRHSQYNSNDIMSHDILSNNNAYQSKCAKASYDGRDRRSAGPAALDPKRGGRGQKASDITATTTITTTYNQNSNNKNNRNSFLSYKIYDISEKPASSPDSASKESGSPSTQTGGELTAQPYLYQYGQQQHQHQQQHQQWYHGRHSGGSKRSSNDSSKHHAVNDLAEADEHDNYDDNVYDDPDWPIRPDTNVHKSTDFKFGTEEV